MDEQLRKAERAYQVDPSVERFIEFLRAQIRLGTTVDLTSQEINNYWDSPHLRQYLQQLPSRLLRICDYPLAIPNRTRTPLHRRVRSVIAQDFEYLYHVQEINEASSALGGEFNIMHVAFAPNGHDAGRFLVITLFNDGYAKHLIDFECDWDEEQWEVVTEFVDYWSDCRLEYNDHCGLEVCSDYHIGTEDHVAAIDDSRADIIQEYFTSITTPGRTYSVPGLSAPDSYDDFIILSWRN